MLLEAKASSLDRHHMLEAAHLYMQVMELGHVGHADDAEGLSAFYVHSQPGATFGDVGLPTQALLRAGDSKVCPCIAATCSRHHTQVRGQHVHAPSLSKSDTMF